MCVHVEQMLAMRHHPNDAAPPRMRKKTPFFPPNGLIQLHCEFVCVCECVFNTWLRGRFHCLPFCESAAGWGNSSSKAPPPDQTQTHAPWVTHTWGHCSAVAPSVLLLLFRRLCFSLPFWNELKEWWWGTKVKFRIMKLCHGKEQWILLPNDGWGELTSTFPWERIKRLKIENEYRWDEVT